MEKISIRDIKIGERARGYLLLLSATEKMAKNNTAYMTLTLTDGESVIEANKWNCDKHSLNAVEKTVVYTEITAKEYQGKKSYEAMECYNTKDCEYQTLDFVIKAPLDSDFMFEEIIRMAEESCAVKEGDNLGRLVKKIYNDHKEKLMYWSSAKAVHHNFYGGLLYHTYRMMLSAKAVLDVYKTADREVVMCAVALHDVGKLYELKTDSLGSAEYTTSGNMLGHSLMGVIIVKDSATAFPGLNPEKILCLEHCLASHHGQLEWGAITQPMMLESFIVHWVDMLDSRIIQFEDEENKTDKGQISDKVFGLGTKVYHPTFRTKPGDIG